MTQADLDRILARCPSWSRLLVLLEPYIIGKGYLAGRFVVIDVEGEQITVHDGAHNVYTII